MKKLTILIDMDDVLDDLLEVWIEELNSLFGTSVKADEVTDWNLQKFFPTLSKKSITTPLFWGCFWDNIKPKFGAVKYTQKMMEDGHDLYVVTATHPQTIAAKFSKVLFRYFPFITYDHVIIASKKQMVLGDVLIDDAPHNLVGGRYKGILFKAPHNASFDAEAHGLIRANDWNEVYRIVCELAQEEEN